MQIAATRLAKTITLMERLAGEIRTFWLACADVQGVLDAEHGLEIDNLNAVDNARDHILATVRTLDENMFRTSDPDSYDVLRKGDSRGEAVRAMTGPRNHSTHGADTYDPDVVNALGPLPGTKDRFVILPRWKMRQYLPPEMFEFKGAFRPGYATAYDAAAAGRALLDTFLDAYGFFADCDARVVVLDADGQLPGFPLPSLPIANRYRRLHPSWPTEYDWNLSERAVVTSAPPGGLRRVITGQVTSDEGVLLCGMTEISRIESDRFVEPLEQVTVDVSLGYRYVLKQVDRTDLLISDGRELRTRGGLLKTSTLPESTADPVRWLGLRELCLDDAAYYRRQRQQPLAPGGAVLGSREHREVRPD